MYEVSGKIKVLFDIQTFASGFSKREFVITTPDDRFPQDLKFETVKDKIQQLDNLAVGQDVTVNFDIRGNEYNDKYYVNLSAWRIQAAGSGQAAAAPQQSQPQAQQQAPASSSPSFVPEPSAADLNSPIQDDEDIPF